MNSPTIDFLFTLLLVLLYLADVLLKGPSIVHRHSLKLSEEDRRLVVLVDFALYRRNLAAEQFFVVTHVLEQHYRVLHVLFDASG